MYVEDAVQFAQSVKSSNAAAGVAAMSLDTIPTPTLWVLVELERPVFCPENSICVASKLEVFLAPLPPKNCTDLSPFARLSMLPAAELRSMDVSRVLFTIPHSECSSRFTRQK